MKEIQDDRDFSKIKGEKWKPDKNLIINQNLFTWTRNLEKSELRYYEEHIYCPFC